MGSRFLFINRYHAREMKAYFAWMRRADLAAAEGNAAVRAELEESWRVMQERMHEVGHAPRYVFGERSYERRKGEAQAALNTLITGNVSYLFRVFAESVEWRMTARRTVLWTLFAWRAVLLSAAGTGPCLRRCGVK
ncbi:putative retrotransposon hot spot protein 4 (RHS4) [Trypanosoma vivax]|nr:putative retrotransposon hot spot protein 4 (RHS4) [Trypanosoma vivax]